MNQVINFYRRSLAIEFRKSTSIDSHLDCRRKLVLIIDFYRLSSRLVQWLALCTPVETTTCLFITEKMMWHTQILMISWTSLFASLNYFPSVKGIFWGCKNKQRKANSRLSLDVIPAPYSNITTVFYKGGNNQFIQGVTFLHQNLAKNQPKVCPRLYRQEASISGCS